MPTSYLIDRHGIVLVGPVPSGLPSVRLPVVDAGDLQTYRITWCGRFSVPFGLEFTRRLAGALGNVPMTIEATLGAADLLLSDLRGLAPGDVLVLRTPLDAAAKVSLPGEDHGFAHAKLTDIDGRMALTFQA